MGLFSWIFSSSGDGETTRVRQNKEDNSKVTADRYTHTEDDGHVHESYNLNTPTGEYKEYHGGENSDERSYNK